MKKLSLLLLASAAFLMPAQADSVDPIGGIQGYDAEPEWIMPEGDNKEDYCDIVYTDHEQPSKEEEEAMKEKEIEDAYASKHNGVKNGNNNAGGYNGNNNGNANFGKYSGNENGNDNVGIHNGNTNGNVNTGDHNGKLNGSDNRGDHNGNMNGNLNSLSLIHI